MTKQCFVERRFKPETLERIGQVNHIIADYQRQGYTLTLRQLFYALVSRAMIPNTVKSYDRLGDVVSNARLAGLVDWEAIEDRTRSLRSVNTWERPEEILDGAARQFRLPLWKRQPVHVELWPEKDALSGVFEPLCRRYRIGLFPCRGYVSQSEQWSAGRRFRAAELAGKRVVILHFGDHDPSGIDMTRDNRERLSMFAELNIEVRRMALNMDQVEEYGPPPNPGKDLDPRWESYRADYGEDSWELDALPPPVLNGIAQPEIESFIDWDLWEEDKLREDEIRVDLKRLADNYDSLQNYMKGVDAC